MGMCGPNTYCITDGTERKFHVVSWYRGCDIHLPRRSTHYSAGYDIESAGAVVIPAGKCVLVDTGIKCDLHIHDVLLLFPRSSLATKHGITLANAVGVIDADYYNNADNEGHIMVPLWNTSDKDYIVKKHDRICQGVITSYGTTDDDNPKGVRAGGFGSTGK